ncbi:hypothetical protein GCM10020001_041730 [Nonomuraea salmonea]
MTENVSGLGFVPVQVPLKPTETDAPVARLPLYGMLVPVTRAPDWLQFAPQPLGGVLLVRGRIVEGQRP